MCAPTLGDELPLSQAVTLNQEYLFDLDIFVISLYFANTYSTIIPLLCDCFEHNQDIITTYIDSWEPSQ